MGNVASPRIDPIIPSARLRHVIFGVVILAALIAGPTDIRNRCRYEGGNAKCDFLIYYEASRAFFDGREPYRDVRLSGGDYYIYPPFFAIAIHPLTAFPAETAGVLWFFINIGFLFASYGEVRRLLEFMLPESLPPVPLLLAIAPTAAVVRPTLSCLQNGQTGIAILYLLLLGARFVLTGRSATAWVGGGIALAAATAIKITPGLPAVVLPVALLIAHGVRPSGDFARRAAACIAGLAVGALLWLIMTPAIALGPGRTRVLLVEHFDKVVVRQQSIHLDSRTNQGLVKATERWIVQVTENRGIPADGTIDISSSGMLAARGVLAVVVVALIAAIISAARQGTALGVTTAFSVAMLGSVLVSPIAWKHHHVVDVAALIFVPLYAHVLGRRREAKLLAIGGIVVINSYYLVRKLTPETPLLGIGMAAWIVVAAVAVVVSASATPWLSRRRDGPHRVITAPGSSSEEGASARGSDC